jgi:O-antigen/teichoic acid export membrane protein
MIPRFLNYLLVPLHTKVLHTAEYGVNTEWYAYVTFLIILLTYGMETGFFRFSQQTDKEQVYGTAFASIMATSALFIAGVMIFSRPLAAWMNYTEHREYLLWFGWILGLDALTAIPFARFRLDNRPMRFAFFKLTGVGVNIFFNLFFLWFCPRFEDCEWIRKVYRPETGVGYIFLSNLIASAVTILLLLPEICRHKIRFRFGLWKRLVAYSLPLMAAGLVGNINEAIDRILLKYRLPEDAQPMEQLGIYGANVKIAVLMAIFIQMFRYAAEPFFFNRSAEKDARSTIALVMKYFVIFCLMIFLGVTCYLDLVKHFLQSPDYMEGLGTVPVMLLANMCLGIYYSLSIWFKLTGNTWYGLLIAATGACISIAGNWLLIPLWGYHASAWMHLTCYAAMMTLTWSIGRKYYPIPYDLKKIFRYISAAIALYFLTRLTRIENIPVNLLKNTIFFAIFVFFIERKEKLLKQILKK